MCRPGDRCVYADTGKGRCGMLHEDCGHGAEVSDSENPDVDCVCIDPGRNDFRSGAGCSERVNPVGIRKG